MRRVALLATLAASLSLPACATVRTERATDVETHSISSATAPRHTRPPTTAAPTTTEAPTTTTTEEPTTTTTEEPTTTTTRPPNMVPLTDEGACHGDQSLRVRVRGSDGETVTAQVSADFKRSGHKVNADGEAISPDQYSETTFIRSEDGTQLLCLSGVPDAEVFLEVYPKNEVDGGFGITTDSRYGSAMWHGVWPGPGQAVTITLPLACSADTSPHGRTGSISFTATLDGQPIGLSRLVAWSRSDATPNHTPGFGVVDARQIGAPEVKWIDQLASDQTYFVQMQTVDGWIMSFEPVPVSTCHETQVALALTGSSCSLTIDGGEAKECRYLDDVVG